MATREELELYGKLIDEHRYDFCKLVYIIFPFGEPGHPLEFMEPYDWQMEEWAKLSRHLANPKTRYETYRLIISSGNGAAKTAFGAMTFMMLMFTQRVRARITANTDPQMKSIVWPEYDIWFNHARHVEYFFEKFGTSIKAKDPKLGEVWRLDTITWSEQTPQAISGLHNKGGCAMYIFEEAPGIPSVIWKYAAGAFTETETIKLHLAFGNSDDPESQFEQNMESSLWRARRIDTRTLKHIDPKQIEAWLIENGGNEDADDFRVRVRGLPRKTAKDSIINLENVDAAIERGKGFDTSSISMLPVTLTCDPAWTGGDETTIWYQQGHYRCLLEKYKLNKAENQDHMFTYLRLCHWERALGADAVLIDQGEGTTIYTLANNAGKAWELISFASTKFPHVAEFQDSEYANMRAYMYYESNKWLQNGGILDVNPAMDKEEREKCFEAIRKQLCWTKGGRHKIHAKKIAEAKADIKARVGSSPDVADGFVLCHARPVLERLPENDHTISPDDRFHTGQGAYQMPDHGDVYEALEVDYRTLYD